jgi:hypothetical protein
MLGLIVAKLLIIAIYKTENVCYFEKLMKISFYRGCSER